MKLRKYFEMVLLGLVICCFYQTTNQAEKVNTKFFVINLSGTWAGNCSDESGPGKMTLSINQNGNNITGDVIITDDKTGISLKGKLQGVINANIVSGNMSFAYDFCNIKIKFSAIIGDNSLTGQYSGFNDCGTEIRNGRMFLQGGGNPNAAGNNNDATLPLPTEEKIKSDLIGQTAITQYGMWQFGSLNEIKRFTIKDKKITNGILEYTIEMGLSDGHIVHVATATVIYKLENGLWKIFGVSFRRFY